MKTRVFKKATFITLLFVVFVGVTLLPGFYAGTSSSSGNPGHNGLEEGSKTWYIPYLAYAVNDQAKLIVTNLEDREADITLKAYAREGNLLDESHPFIHIGAKQAKTIDLFLLPQGTETLKLESEALLTASVILEKAGLTRPVIIPAVKDTGKRLDFPQLVEGDAFYKEITLFNPNEFPCISPMSIFAIDANGWEIGADILPSLLSFENRRILLRDIFDDDILQSATNFRIEADKSLLGLQVTDNSSGALVSLPAAVIAGEEWTLDISMNDDPGEIWLSIGIFNPENFTADVLVEAFDMNNHSMGIIEQTYLPSHSTYFVKTRSNNGIISGKAAFLKISSSEDVCVYKVTGNPDHKDINASFGKIDRPHTPIEPIDSDDLYREYGDKNNFSLNKEEKEPYSESTECYPQLNTDGLPTFHWPLEGKQSDYKWYQNRWDYTWKFGKCGKEFKRHVGLDFSLIKGNIKGKKVLAVYDGQIRDIFFEKGWMYSIIIEHLDKNKKKFTTNYNHVIPVKGLEKNQFISTGELIATVADLNANSHLHYSIRRYKFDGISYRGALPIVNSKDCKCGGDPVFPEYFIDPSTASYSDQSGTGTVGGRLHELSITVKPLANANVSCGGQDTKTSSDGYYSLSNVPAGEQILKFSKPGYIPYEKSITIIKNACVYAGDNYLIKEKKTLISISINGPFFVDENSRTFYIAKAKFSDGTEQTITDSCTWSENSKFASFDSNLKGLLITKEVEKNQLFLITITYLAVGKPAPYTAHQVVFIKDKPSSTKLTSLKIIGPSEVDENFYSDYKVRAKFSDNSIQWVTGSVTWSEDSPYIHMDTNIKNRMISGEVPSNQRVKLTATYVFNGITHPAEKYVDIIDKAASKTLTSISISGPSSVNENSYADYSATALFSDGSSQVVTASSIWEENSSYANMDPAIKGRLVTGEVSSNQTVTVTATFTYNGVTKSANNNVTIIDNNSVPPYSIIGDNPTTNGWSYWDKPLLELKGVIISGTTRLKLIVTKIGGAPFEFSGTVYFKVGTYEPWGVNRKIDYTIKDKTTEVIYEHDLSEYPGPYPKEFYVRHEPYEGGYSWVGPITVIQNSN